MVVCKHCGAHLTNAIKYCQNCGHELSKGNPMSVALKINNKRLGDSKLRLTKNGPILSLKIRTPDKEARKIISISKAISRKVYPIFSTKLVGYFDEDLDITLKSLGRKVISFYEKREEPKREKYFYKYAKKRANKINSSKKLLK